MSGHISLRKVILFSTYSVDFWHFIISFPFSENNVVNENFKTVSCPCPMGNLRKKFCILWSPELKMFSMASGEEIKKWRWRTYVLLFLDGTFIICEILQFLTPFQGNSQESSEIFNYKMNYFINFTFQKWHKLVSTNFIQIIVAYDNIYLQFSLQRDWGNL